MDRCLIAADISEEERFLASRMSTGPSLLCPMKRPCVSSAVSVPTCGRSKSSICSTSRFDTRSCQIAASALGRLLGLFVWGTAAVCPITRAECGSNASSTAKKVFPTPERADFILPASIANPACQKTWYGKPNWQSQPSVPASWLAFGWTPTPSPISEAALTPPWP